MNKAKEILKMVGNKEAKKVGEALKLKPNFMSDFGPVTWNSNKDAMEISIELHDTMKKDLFDEKELKVTVKK